jgi:RNA polymerase sigma factor (sigma-70 family)
MMHRLLLLPASCEPLVSHPNIVAVYAAVSRNHTVKETAVTIAHVLELVSLDYPEMLLVPISVDAIPLPQLLSACREHLARFRHGAESDPQFCLELFRRALDAHDPDAWHGLVELYQPLLSARLRQRGVAPEMAEEAVQEAFVALWLKSNSGAVSTSGQTLAQVLNYLWGSIRFALIKLRRQQHDVPLAPDCPLELEFTSTGDETTVVRALDAQALLARIRKLVTAHEWQALWLRFGRELPPREIAVQLAIPVEEVYFTLASAKRRLRSDPQLRTFMELNSHL